MTTKKIFFDRGGGARGGDAVSLYEAKSAYSTIFPYKC